MHLGALLSPTCPVTVVQGCLLRTNPLPPEAVRWSRSPEADLTRIEHDGRAVWCGYSKDFGRRESETRQETESGTRPGGPGEPCLGVWTFPTECLAEERPDLRLIKTILALGQMWLGEGKTRQGSAAGRLWNTPGGRRWDDMCPLFLLSQDSLRGESR